MKENSGSVESHAILLK